MSTQPAPAAAPAAAADPARPLSIPRSLFVFSIFYGGMVCIAGVLANKQARGAFGQVRMETIVRDALPAGTYYILVEDYGRDHPIDRYALRLAVLPAPDQVIAGPRGRYRILAEHGRGGFGVTYRGERVGDGHPVKYLVPEKFANNVIGTGPASLA